MRPWIAVVAVSFALAQPASSQQRPLKTDDADIVPLGRIRAEIGMEFLQSQRFSISGLEGDLTRLGIVSIHVGVGEYAEFQIAGVLQDYLAISRRYPSLTPYPVTGNTTNDFGDLVLATKLRFAGGKGRKPSLAFKFAVQLPNASQSTGLGNDTTEFYSSVLASKHIGSLWVLGNVGLAILGSPIAAGQQADMLTYGFGIIMPVNRRINLVAEINGRNGPTRQGNEPQSVIRAGAQVWTGPVRWDVAGIAGLEPYDPHSGLAVGITYEFQGFHRKRDNAGAALPNAGARAGIYR
jgi:hypothetical protein